MKIIYEFVKELTILTPEPPSKEERAKELKVVIEQQKNPANDKSILVMLDEDFPKMFDAIIKSAGHSSDIKTIQKLKKEIKPIVKLHKNHFDYLRPRELAEDIGVDFDSKFLKSAQSPSYPSGHTSQAFYVAHHLSEKYPELSEKFYLLAEMVAESRVDLGVHFPSDNLAGKILAYKVFNGDLT